LVFERLGHGFLEVTFGCLRLIPPEIIDSANVNNLAFLGDYCGCGGESDPKFSGELMLGVPIEGNLEFTRGQNLAKAVWLVIRVSAYHGHLDAFIAVVVPDPLNSLPVTLGNRAVG
jgi:hypothetical protein